MGGGVRIQARYIHGAGLMSSSAEDARVHEQLAEKLRAMQELEREVSVGKAWTNGTNSASKTNT